MNGGKIWWNQIGNSLKFVSGIATALEAQRSVVLQVPAHIPWSAKMYDAVDVYRTAFCGERLLKRLRWKNGEDPGVFLMKVEEFCSERVRKQYWPGVSRAAYLGGLDGIFLHEHYIWITDIRTAADMDRWLEFVSRYREANKSGQRRAVFLLEYSGPERTGAKLETIEYRVESYDCRVFSMEAASMLGNSRLKSYQAELAYSMSQGDPEFCWALLETGERLLSQPVATALAVHAALSANGHICAPLDQQKAHSSAWEAAAVLLFPRLEQWRIRFVAEHEMVLSYKLPIRNSNGEQITDPRDLELGSLWFVVNNSGARFSPEEAALIRRCREIRNLLAHNKLLTREQVQSVLEL